MDQVQFSATAPWPVLTGNRTSLQRFDLQAYGDDPVNWRVGAFNPGSSLPGGIALVLLSIDTDRGDGSPVLRFPAESNRSYDVQFTDALGGDWQRLQSYGAAVTNRVLTLKEMNQTKTRYYRLVTPSAP